MFFVFGAHAFIWGTTSVTIRQRAVPTTLQGRVGSVNMVGIYGGLVIGSGIGGVLAQHYGVTAPFWFAFVGSAVFVIVIWRQLSHIAHEDQRPQLMIGGRPHVLRANRPLCESSSLRIVGRPRYPLIGGHVVNRYVLLRVDTDRSTTRRSLRHHRISPPRTRAPNDHTNRKERPHDFASNRDERSQQCSRHRRFTEPPA